ncbi:hypothetical protein A7981_06435 [Methylovorus sp. MM2]|uniref:hypothetical protein n=1 Tax=Methylovorus sp. MM2 TaxID=1848038 RepID=UPI0007DEA48E|nr:hypothetical protein [Methylovorus sp. MM2]OAM53055.1 hypothetical protein A7981_06435 [Methylovorus sp. MM2]
MQRLVLALVALLITNITYAQPAFTGVNYSGLYDCKGNNEQVGDYSVVVKLRLNRISSYGKFGAYYYEVETENSVLYAGQAAVDGNRMAISFNLSEKRSAEHSTGIATMKKNPQGRWSFQKLYYESDDSGGIYGKETCVLKAAIPASKTGSTKKN